jgi:uncharacterized membrane protein YbhN (UPF0104 family)
MGLSLTILLVFIVFIEIYIGWLQLLLPWRSVPVPMLVLAVGMVVGSYALRAVRLYAYFHAAMQGAFSVAFKLMLQHNLANNFLPMRSGEISFPLLMSRYFKISLSRSLPALLWFRLLDLHILGLLGLWAIGSQWLHPYLFTLLALLWLLLPWGLYLANHWLLEKLAFAQDRGRLLGLMTKLLEGAPASSRLLLITWFWSLLNWLTKLAAFAWLLALFAQIPLVQSLLGVLGGELTSVLPVHGVAGVGTYEAGIVAALLPFGIAAEVAVSSAVNVHLFLLGVTLLGGGLSLLLKVKDGH